MEKQNTTIIVSDGRVSFSHHFVYIQLGRKLLKSLNKNAEMLKTSEHWSINVKSVKNLLVFSFLLLLENGFGGIHAVWI